MRNFVSRGEKLNVVYPYAVNAGSGALIGALFGVAACNQAQGSAGALVTVGVYDLPKAAGAVAIGAKLYWDDAAKKLTTTAAGNTYVAVALAAAVAGAASVTARLNGFVV